MSPSETGEPVANAPVSGRRESIVASLRLSVALLATTFLWTSVALVTARPAVAVPGDLTLMSTSDSGVKGIGDSFDPSVSADGTIVAFSTQADNLDPADTDPVTDVYVKDLVTGNLTLVSTSASGVKGNGTSDSPSLSADGTKVAFVSTATNLDPADIDTGMDVYVKDLVSGNLTLVSTTFSGAKGTDNSLFPSVSGDGTKVGFASFAINLDPADTDNVMDVYVKDLVTGNLTLVSTTSSGVKGNGSSDRPSLSADGSKVAFGSNADNLDPADVDDPDVYVKDLVTGNLMLASTSDTGVKGNDDSNGPSLSADGTKVAFRSSADNLDPADPVNDFFFDAYVKDLVTGDLTLASTSDSGVKGNDETGIPSLSADGTKVAFDSNADNLEQADTDTDEDVYLKELEGPSSPIHRCRGLTATIVGSTGPDVIVGTPGADVIVGLGGNDRISGVGGNDVICGGGGKDILNGGAGGDQLIGGKGNDRLRGGSGADRLRGDAGNDRLHGGPGADQCNGGAGIDTGRACEAQIGIP
jgi:Tol biopolymer transport system component